jgi:hypothetical protein
VSDDYLTLACCGRCQGWHLLGGMVAVLPPDPPADGRLVAVCRGCVRPSDPVQLELADPDE